MRNFKNIIIYIFVCIIILTSFKLPEILCEIIDDNIEIAVYEKEKDKNKLGVEVEEIYLVKAIHDIEKEDSSVKISSSKVAEVFSLVESVEGNTKITQSIYKELIKLKDYNILKAFEVNENDYCKIELINKSYKKDSNEYTLNTISLQINDEQYNLEIENKTGKILYITFDKDNIDDKAQEEIMKNYIEYLDLYIIDDWNFENNMLKSEKADLVVNLVESGDHYILSIHTIDIIYNIWDYTDILR